MLCERQQRGSVWTETKPCFQRVTLAKRPPPTTFSLCLNGFRASHAPYSFNLTSCRDPDKPDRLRSQSPYTSVYIRLFTNETITFGLQRRFGFLHSCFVFALSRWISAFPDSYFQCISNSNSSTFSKKRFLVALLLNNSGSNNFKH